MKNITNELRKLKKHLQGKSDENLIKGYKNAMKDYDEKGDEQTKLAADIIKEEIDRRGIKL